MKDSKLLSDQDIDKKIDKYYQWKETFLGKIEDWWDHFLGYKIKDFITSSKNIIRWFPIIWKDRDWDDSYIFEVLKQKIKFTSEYNKKRKTYIGVEREIQLMDVCVKLIDRIQNEYYEEIGYDKLEQKYGAYKEWKFEPLTDRPGLTELIIEREYEHLYSEEEQNKDYKEIMDIAYDKHRKARKLLFRILEEKIEHWWS